MIIIGSAAVAIASLCGLTILGFSPASPALTLAVLIYASVGTLGGIGGSLIGHFLFPAASLFTSASIDASALLFGMALLHLCAHLYPQKLWIKSTDERGRQPGRPPEGEPLRPGGTDTG